MKVIEARNPHMALPWALTLLDRHAVRRGSRNGDVLVMPTPVTTVYSHPTERVVFWAARDANPFFHLYEAVWMLAGRNDIRALTRYAANIANYSDDGETQHGAYGFRWRQAFGRDQLVPIATALKNNPEDRRNVLQMWDTRLDLGHAGKDVPCNVTATFQRDVNGALDLCVFNRSNDIIWGCYGANAVHFSMLLEYMAAMIGCPVGRYYQISANWHAYDNALYQRVSPLKGVINAGFAQPISYRDPYTAMDGHWVGEVHVLSLVPEGVPTGVFDWQVDQFLRDEASDFQTFVADRPLLPFVELLYTVFRAHAEYRRHEGEDRYERALTILHDTAFANVDWIVACREWLERRWAAYRDRTAS